MILVVGTGRSGTTTTARVLHEQLGISMGERFLYAKGGEVTYEDADFSALNRLANGRYIGRPALISGLANLARVRDHLHGDMWGVKDPASTLLLGAYVAAFPAARIAWAWRPLEDCVHSLARRFRSYTLNQAWEELWPLWSALHDQPTNSDWLKLDFTERRDETEIRDELAAFLDLEVPA